VFDFGLRIQELRMKHNLSQSELGKKINKSKTAIWGYENNVRIPPLEALVDIAVVLNVSLDYLVGIDKNEMVSLNGLSDDQKTLVYTLIEVLKNDKRPNEGLSDKEKDTIESLMVELYKKQK